MSPPGRRNWLASSTTWPANCSAAALVAEILTGVVAAGQALIPEADLVSVTLRDPRGGYSTPVATGEPADALDQLQYTHNQGPCVSASRSGPQIIDVSDLKATSPWPRRRR